MKVGILGTGSAGRGATNDATKSEYVTEIIAYDINQESFEHEKLQELIEESKISIRTTTNIADVLDDPEVKLVFVTASNDAHKELVEAAIKAGKAILCEKPIATTMEDSEKLVRMAEEKGVYIQVGFELRYAKLYTTIKDWIDQGLLGDVVNTHCTYTTPAFAKDSWRVSAEVTGGMFAEKLCHYVDLPRWWIGSEVEEVITFSAPNTVPYFEVRDNYHTSYRFKNGAVSHITFMMGPSDTYKGDPLMDTANDEKEKVGHCLKYTIVGTKGAAEASVYGRTIKRWQYTDSPETMKSELVEVLTWDGSENTRYYHDKLTQSLDVIERVHKGLPPKTSAWDALKTMKLTFAAEESATTQKLIKLENC